VATLSTTFASAGTQSLSAVFTPADLTDFSGSTGTLSLPVNPAATPTTTTLAVSQSGTPGTDVSLSATVLAGTTPVTAGTVSFFDNGSATPLNPTPVTPNASGVAAFDIPAGLGAGGHSIVAVFTPTDVTQFESSQSAPATFTDTAVPTSTTISAAGTGVAGGQVTFTSTVTDASNNPVTQGTVTFYDNGTSTPGSGTKLGTATSSTSSPGTFVLMTAVPGGVHSVVADYVPSTGSPFAASQSEAVTFSQPADATKTVLSQTGGGGVAGTVVNFTATVTDTVTGNPVTGGSVSFFQNGSSTAFATVASTTGTFATSYSKFGAEPQSVVAAYTAPSGGEVLDSTSSAVTFVETAPPAPPATSTLIPVVFGNIRVGQTATCVAGAKAGTTLSYSWRSNGKKVKGHTARTFSIYLGQLGKTLSCAVVAKTNGVSLPSVTSAGVKVKLGLKVQPVIKPVLWGPHTRGKREMVTPGAWKPAATTKSYQWYIGSTPIKGATKPYYTPSKKDVGLKINCVVTVTRAGFADGGYRTAGVKITG
jgi:hypothetical protein